MQVFLCCLLDVEFRYLANKLWIALGVVKPEAIEFDLQHKAHDLALAVETQREAANQVLPGGREFVVRYELILDFAKLRNDQLECFLCALVLGLEHHSKSTREFSSGKCTID